MTLRKIQRLIPSMPTSDGAGVRLRRSLGSSEQLHGRRLPSTQNQGTSVVLATSQAMPVLPGDWSPSASASAQVYPSTSRRLGITPARGNDSPWRDP